MYKVAVFDLDGTLLNHDLEISSGNLDAIKKIRELGIKVVIATGRPEQLVKPYMDQLQYTDDLIMYNGSVIGHPFKEKRFFSKALDKKTVKEVIEYCEAFDILYMCYTKDMLISKPNFRVEFFEQRNLQLEEKNRSVFKDIGNKEDIYENYEINKILIIEKDDIRFEQVLIRMNECKNVSIVSSQKGFIDINPLNTSKGDAVRRLTESMKVSKDEIIAFGDQDNDVSMLEYAGFSVAMANASAKAKAAADYITTSNDEDGVAFGLHEHILNIVNKISQSGK